MPRPSVWVVKFQSPGILVSFVGAKKKITPLGDSGVCVCVEIYIYIYVLP